MKNRTPIAICLLLSLLEAAVFALISYFSYWLAVRAVPPLAGASYLREILSQFSNLVISIATTWYVVFTYYILRANSELRDLSLDPHVLVSWAQASELSDTRFSGYSVASDFFRKSFGTSAPELHPGDGTARYVNIVLGNIRTAEIVEISLTFQVTVKSEQSVVFRKDGASVVVSDVTLGKQVPINVTLLDLNCIPDALIVQIEILKIQYRDIVKRAVYTQFTGPSSYSLNGITRYATVSPEPKQDTMR